MSSFIEPITELIFNSRAPSVILIIMGFFSPSLIRREARSIQFCSSFLLMGDLRLVVAGKHLVNSEIFPFNEAADHQCFIKLKKNMPVRKE